jgi:hypothetical protein
MIDPMLLALIIAIGTIALADSVLVSIMRVMRSAHERADERSDDAPLYEHVEIDDARSASFMASLADSFRLDVDATPADPLAPVPLGPMSEDQWYAAALHEIETYSLGFLDRRLPLVLPADFAAQVHEHYVEIVHERDEQTGEFWHLVDTFTTALTTPTGEYALVTAPDDLAELAEALLVS